MLSLLSQKFQIQPIIEQVTSLNPQKRIDLNVPTGKFFNDIWKIKDDIVGTPLGNVLNSLPNIGQARLLTLESGESYTAHTDPDDRIHLPIITNDFSYLIDITNNTMHHIPADGSLWYMDTSRTHVATNWGSTARIHLNIRMLLPHFDISKAGIHIKVVDGPFDWKQLSYIELMGEINRSVKSNIITGFDSSNERELFLNCDSNDFLNDVLDRIKSRGVDIRISKI
jgi:hypothetical protein